MAKLSKKAIINIITVVLAVILISGWIFLAYIHLEGAEYAGKYNPRSGTKYIAHRGYSAKYFENTYEAFRAAAEENFFQAIETDVYLTADGEYVCSHDENPFVDKSIKITEKTYAEIMDLPLDLTKAPDAADKTLSYRICRLSDYLTLCKGYRKTAVVEIKQNLTKEQATALAKFVASKTGWTDAVFCSFKKDPIDYIYAEHPYADVMLFTSNKTKASLYHEMNFNIGVSEKIISEKLIKKAHKAGVYVNVYTVNDKEAAKKYAAAGVDFITTDDVLAE